MIKDYEESQRKKGTGIRSTMDMIMGTIIILVGLYFLLYDLLNINVFNRAPSLVLDIVIGILFILYGSWRFYRGVKRNY